MPVSAIQLMFLNALVATGPRLALIEAILAAGYVRVHCRAAGSEPAGEARFRFKETVPSAPAVPEDSVRESVCAKETRAKSRNVNVTVGARMPLVRRILIGYRF